MNSDVVDRLNAALEGRYRIERELGEGGMATVYLAADLKHERRVALKVLKPELAAVVGADRFLGEIKTTANLQHPHILPLFDSGEAEQFLFYVMPYVEGESLRDKLDREKQLPVDEAVRIATDVAEALHTAHQQDVIHRDIKPANILLSQGRPLVADFGIALAVSTAGGGRLTETGLSLGTPHYMSPEQATGDVGVGATTDVYALGCVLYEMLVGEPPYTGSTAQAILGKIIAGEPAAATKHRSSVPAHVDAAIRKALEKVPADRFAGAAVFAKALSDPGFRHRESGAVAVTAAGGTWSRRTLVTAGVAALAGLGLGRALARPTPAVEPAVATRVAIEGRSSALAVSRDGRSFVKVDTEEGEELALYVRAADDPEWRRLPNTEGATDPSFSPDGQWLAFRVGQDIWKVPVTGGVRLPIASGGSRDPHWAFPDTIVYGTGSGEIYLVGASGENPRLLFDSDSIIAAHPHLLPNGEAVLFSSLTLSDPTASRIRLLEIASGRVRELIASGTDASYVPTGHIIYGHSEQALMGVPFDLELLEVTGTPITLLPALAVGRADAGFAVSETGTLLYDAAPLSGELESVLVEVSLDGVERTLPIGFPRLHEPRYSPDGSKIVYGDLSDIRIYDVVSGANPPFATGFEPKWSANGDFVYFYSLLGEGMRRRRTDPGAEVEVLTGEGPPRSVTDVAPGDSIIVFRERSDERGWDLRLMRLGAGGPVFEDLLTADWNEVNADVSPDGNWVAYQADQGGMNRVLVRSFPVIGPPHVISPDGGIDPLWSPDGRTIYYSNGSRFMAVDVVTEPAFSASPPRLMFEEPSYVTLDGVGTDNNWHVHPDGDRFLLVKSPLGRGVNGESTSRMFVVTNWFTELCERMGGCG